MCIFEIEFLSFLVMCPGVGLLDHMVALFLVVEGVSVLSSMVAAPVYVPPAVLEGSLFSTPPPAFATSRLW